MARTAAARKRTSQPSVGAPNQNRPTPVIWRIIRPSDVSTSAGVDELRSTSWAMTPFVIDPPDTEDTDVTSWARPASLTARIVPAPHTVARWPPPDMATPMRTASPYSAPPDATGDVRTSRREGRGRRSSDGQTGAGVPVCSAARPSGSQR